jgi:UDP-GlcNAc:undecaprenyl-phosphate GlcNAc-1-phosphate transferase
VTGLLAGSPVIAAAGFALAGAILGFLKFNRPPAAVFLGDLGSLTVGFVLAALTLALAARAGSLPRALAPAFAAAYPLFDLTFVTVTRAATGRRIDRGGVDHTSHRLARAFDSTGRAALVIGAVSLVFAVTAVVRFGGGSWGSFALTTAAALTFFLWMGSMLLRRGA